MKKIAMRKGGFLNPKVMRLVRPVVVCLAVLPMLGQSTGSEAAPTENEARQARKTVIVGPQDHLQEALNQYTAIYLKAGDYHVDGLTIPAARRIIAYPGADIYCKGDFEIGPGSYVEGVTVYKGRIIIRDDSRLVDCTSIEASRQRDDLTVNNRNGFMIMGDNVTLRGCIARRASYAGINVRGSANIENCRVYGLSYVALSVNHRGKPIDQITIRDFYCEKTDGGVQLDSRSEPVRNAYLTNIHIGPLEKPGVPMKLATCDHVVVDNLYAPHPSTYGLVLAEGLGQIIIKNSVLREGITQFPEPGRPGQTVENLTLRDVQMGPSDRPLIWDHLKVERLVLDNVKFPEKPRVHINRLKQVILRDVYGSAEALKTLRQGAQ